MAIKIVNHHIRTAFVFLMVSEYALLFLSVYVGIYFRFDILSWQPVAQNLQYLPVRAIVFASTMLVGMLAMGQYQAPGSQGRHTFPFVLIRVILGAILGTLALAVVYYIFPDVILGRGIASYAIASIIVGLSLYRVVLYKLIDGKALRKKILVLGAGHLAAEMMQNDKSNEQDAVFKRKGILSPLYASYTIHGFVDTGDEEIAVPEQYIIKQGESLVDYCLEYGIDEIVLAIGDRRGKVPVDDLLECKLSNIQVQEYVSFWEKEKGLLRTDMLNPSWLVFCEGCQQGDFESFMGRVFDVSVSILILIMMLPALILTTILIFIENGFSGPIFYRQDRVGFNGKVFQLLKFRSMVVNAESDGKAQWATKNDTRVTWVGRFIRKVRIDELPQMLNILKGDMSLVGPRPERPEFVDILEKKIPFFSTRHRVKPGLAGWAQLKYPYGADEHDAMKKLQYDLYYVKNHSIFMDFMVLLQTIEIVILGKGAR